LHFKCLNAVSSCMTCVVHVLYNETVSHVLTVNSSEAEIRISRYLPNSYFVATFLCLFRSKFIHATQKAYQKLTTVLFFALRNERPVTQCSIILTDL
jgi:hypothetical protein